MKFIQISLHPFRFTGTLPSMFIEHYSRMQFGCILAFALFFPWSNALSQIATGISLGLWITQSILQRRVLIAPALFNKALLLFFMVGVFSCFMGIDWTHSVYRLRQYRHFLIIYLIASSGMSLEDLKKMFIVLAMSIGGYSIYYLVKYIYLINHGVYYFDVGRITRAGQLMIGFGWLLFWFLAEKTMKRKLLVGLALLLVCVGLIINFKRGSWMGMTIILFLAGYLKSWKIPLVGILLMLVVFSVYTPVRTRIQMILTYESGVDSIRTELWRICPMIIKNHPWGVGINNAPTIMHRYSSKLDNFKDFHNNFAHILVEQGYPGILAFLLLIVTIPTYCIQTFLLLRRNKSERIWVYFAYGVFAIFIAYLCNGLVVYNFGDSENLMFLSFMLGCLVLIRQNITHPPAPPLTLIR
jgi:O-antigen ligase